MLTYVPLLSIGFTLFNFCRKRTIALKEDPVFTRSLLRSPGEGGGELFGDNDPAGKIPSFAT